MTVQAQVMKCRIEGPPPKRVKDAFRVLTSVLKKPDKNKKPKEQSPLTYIYSKSGVSIAADGHRIIRLQTDLDDGYLNRGTDWLSLEVAHKGWVNEPASGFSSPYPIDAVDAIIRAQCNAQEIDYMRAEDLLGWYSTIWNTLRFTTPAVRSALRVKFPFSKNYFRARPLLALLRAMQHACSRV